MTDYFQKKIDVLLAAYKDASSRTRSVFLTMNIATAICMAVVLNSSPFLSAADFTEKSHITSKLVCEQELKTIMAKEMAFIQIPIIGIKIYITDLGLMTTFTMAVLCTWFYFSVRRERMIVTEVYNDLVEVKSKGNQIEDHLFDYVHQGLVNQSVFSTSTSNDYFNKETKLYRKNVSGRFFVNTLLLYSPLIVIAIVFIRDMYILSTVLDFEINFIFFIVKNMALPLVGLAYCLVQIGFVSKNENDKQEKLQWI
jgi:hypothetical protein